MKLIYLSLCIAGTILPWFQFVPWLLENGFDLSLLIQEAFSSRISAFAWLDVVVSAVVVLIFVLIEGRRVGVRHLWAPFIAMFVVGVSLALPLFLLMRQIRMDERHNNGLNVDVGKVSAR